MPSGEESGFTPAATDVELAGQRSRRSKCVTSNRPFHRRGIAIYAIITAKAYPPARAGGVAPFAAPAKAAFGVCATKTRWVIMPPIRHKPELISCKTRKRRRGAEPGLRPRACSNSLDFPTSHQQQKMPRGITDCFTFAPAMEILSFLSFLIRIEILRQKPLLFFRAKPFSWRNNLTFQNQEPYQLAKWGFSTIAHYLRLKRCVLMP